MNSPAAVLFHLLACAVALFHELCLVEPFAPHLEVHNLQTLHRFYHEVSNFWVVQPVPGDYMPRHMKNDTISFFISLLPVKTLFS
jgi:hypothetical protein